PYVHAPIYPLEECVLLRSLLYCGQSRISHKLCVCGWNPPRSVRMAVPAPCGDKGRILWLRFYHICLFHSGENRFYGIDAYDLPLYALR
ncbi:hypothetical protein S245_070747, partial [Arachis hypogaea]